MARITDAILRRLISRRRYTFMRSDMRLQVSLTFARNLHHCSSQMCGRARTSLIFRREADPVQLQGVLARQLEDLDV